MGFSSCFFTLDSRAKDSPRSVEVDTDRRGSQFEHLGRLLHTEALQVHEVQAGPLLWRECQHHVLE